MNHELPRSSNILQFFLVFNKCRVYDQKLIYCITIHTDNPQQFKLTYELNLHGRILDKHFVCGW
jgi:hypothetical protein